MRKEPAQEFRVGPSPSERFAGEERPSARLAARDRPIQGDIAENIVEEERRSPAGLAAGRIQRNSCAGSKPAILSIVLVVAAALPADDKNPTKSSNAPPAESSELKPGMVRCANLTYARNKSSVCFASAFLKDASEATFIETDTKFASVRLDASDLFRYPFAVMTGEGSFSLTESERRNMRSYLHAGGFMVASAGCSSKPWNESFERELAAVFPKLELTVLGADHPVYHTVYDVTSSRYKSGGSKLPLLRALEIDGRVVLIWSPDGLNDSKNAGQKCCCCGGNEIKSAKLINVNLLAYALTH